MTMTLVEEPMTEYLFSVYGTSVRCPAGVAPVGPTSERVAEAFSRGFPWYDCSPYDRVLCCARIGQTFPSPFLHRLVS